MNLFEKITGYTFSQSEQQTWAQKAESAVMLDGEKTQSSYYGQEYPIIETSWDGEKTQGELGAPLSYMPDYTALSYRSWKAFTDSDLAQIIIKAHINWVIGIGLKLQAEPSSEVIESEGVNFNKNEFVRTIENRFRLFVKTKNSVHSQMMNFQQLQRLLYLNACVGGDVLCIMRMEDGLPTMEVIEGIHIQTPDIEKISKAEKLGNKIVHGVELNSKKQHVRYYYRGDKGEFKSVNAIGEKSKKELAFLFYPSEYRIDSVRGLPLLSAVLEKISKLDRYNEAIVATAEEQAKVPWWFEHKEFSTGENPDLSKLTGAITGANEDTGDAKVVDMTAQTKAVKKTFEKEAYNLPVGATMKKLESGMEKDQEAFTTGNFIYICAALEIPYEVALMKYVNSFSSSRMASQSFLFILNIKRMLFTDTVLKKYYSLFLDSQILSGKVNAEGYFTAMNKKDVILLEAYRSCRFSGPGVPQADPSKEVKAEVEKINANLTTREQSMERLNNGDDFYATIDKLAEEENKINDTLPSAQQPEEEDSED